MTTQDKLNAAVANLDRNPSVEAQAEINRLYDQLTRELKVKGEFKQFILDYLETPETIFELSAESFRQGWFNHATVLKVVRELEVDGLVSRDGDKLRTLPW